MKAKVLRIDTFAGEHGLNVGDVVEVVGPDRMGCYKADGILGTYGAPGKNYELLDDEACITKYQNPTLNERESTHGDYADTARIAQELKGIIGEAITNNSHEFSDVMRESLDMACTKIARICSGDPSEADHWRDGAGYFNLVSERLERD